LNGYFKHKRIHQYIWHQDTHELRSIIDYIITRQNSGLKFQGVRVFIGMTVGSDHYLVNGILFSKGTIMQVNQGKT
jgi:hypothetical protein